MVPEFIQIVNEKGSTCAINVQRILSVTDLETHREIILSLDYDIMVVRCSTPLFEISKQIGEARDAERASMG
jgi:hypothetical protein